MTKKLLILFFGSLLLFAVVAPGNHSEAEDAFEYSRLIEEGRGAELCHPHHLLYLPAQKVLFGAAQRFGYAGRSYYVARAVSMVSASLALGLFYLLGTLLMDGTLQQPVPKFKPETKAVDAGQKAAVCESNYLCPSQDETGGLVLPEMQPDEAEHAESQANMTSRELQTPNGTRSVKRQTLPLLGTLGLLFSYGFLRYACEVEIYLPAMALALAALCSSMQGDRSKWWFALTLLLSSGAVLMHTINAGAALVVIPLIYVVIFRNIKRALFHIAATLTIIGGVYALIHNTCGLFAPPVDAATEGMFNSGTLWKSAVGLGQCLLSANFLFSGAGAEQLQAMFPYRVFAEEIFAAVHMPVWMRIVAPITFGAALIGLLVMAGLMLFYAIRKRWCDGLLIILFIWLGATAFPVMLLEPSNPELWILALPPCWAICLRLAGNLSNRRRMWMYVAVLLLGGHNLIAGLGAVRSPEGDYNAQKAKWIIQHADADDVIHTSESFVFSFYLDYWGQAEVRNVNTQAWKAGRKSYVLDDVFNPSSAIAIRYPAFAANVSRAASALRPRCEKIYDDEFGGIWILNDSQTVVP